uniref:Chlororespiratory reduction31 n=1 Tax=Monsonia emarginata TaxID=28966 RepID=A0A0F7GZI0_9ROSI
MASSSITLPSLQGHQLKSQFLGRKLLPSNSLKLPFSASKHRSTSYPKASAKFNLFEVLGGRGLCNGEKGIEEELKKSIEEQQQPPSSLSSPPAETEQSLDSETSSSVQAPEDGFDKELMGLTGGFPGGETGLQKFIEKNPPPPKKTASSSGEEVLSIATTKKPKAPELPLLMPGMIAIVKNPNSPFHMYCGIVQRITDGKAGVLFEGGNWDRLVTFRLEELERREKGPPAKNPKSVVLEALIKKDSQ